jgi:sporulation protein YlmC with PRC-barrel domain
MSVGIDQVLDWRGRTVVDRDGRKVGVFDEIYIDEETHQPTWAAVKMGTLRLRRRVVPVAEAEPFEGGVRIPFTKDDVRSAPTIDSDGWVSERDTATILRHYGMRSAQASDSRGDGPTGPVPDAEGGADVNEDAEARPERVQLKRYTVTETVTRRSEFTKD